MSDGSHDTERNAAKIGTDVALAAGLLRSGKPVGLPTETVYGLAANGLDPAAVTQIFHIKNRPFFDPLILHVSSIQQALTLSHSWSESAEKLAQAFWPGPLTLVLPKSNIVPDIVSSGYPTVAIRMPQHPLALSLLHALDFPLAAPSANPFGYVSPTTAQHVAQQLGSRLDYILDGGPCSKGIESTIVSCIPNEIPKILRLGSLSAETIVELVGELDESLTQNSNPQAPGQLDQHYSPYCQLLPLIDFHSHPPIGNNYKQAIVFYSANQTLTDTSKALIAEGADCLYLSEQGNLQEAAQHLFSMLRFLDENNYRRAWFEWVPDRELGRAINDRLRRAAAKR